MQKKVWKTYAAFFLATAMTVTSLSTSCVLAEGEGSSATVDNTEVKDYIVDGGFEAENLNAWTCTEWSVISQTKKDGEFKEGLQALSFWSEQEITVTMTQKISLPAGNYKLSAQSQGNDGETVSVIFNGQEGDKSQTDSGWGNWEESSGIFKLEEDTEVEAGIKIAITAAKGWGKVDCVSLTAVTEEEEPSKPGTTLEDVTKLLAAVPNDYKTMGFTEDSLKSLTDAMAMAEALTGESTQEEIKAAYDALNTAINNLTLSADVFIKKVENYDAGSIRGMDVSSYLSIMENFEQVKKDMKTAGAGEEEIAKIGFKDQQGNVLDEQGFFDLLADSGVNYIRLRVWNDPFNSENGKGYGGGNVDIKRAAIMGKYITNAGMKTLLDFHLSDFWADPGKQKAPKKWEKYSVDEKVTAVKEYITESLQYMKDQGAEVHMVQIGNETNNAVCGENDWNNMNRIFDAGCEAVKAFDKNILRVIHFTNPEKEGNSMSFAKNLSEYDRDGDGKSDGVDYDIFATSYYPNSHGTMDNLTQVLANVAKTYNKYVMVAETAWAYTYDDGDAAGGTKYNTGEYVNYNVSVQGQVNAVHDVIEAVNNIDVKIGENKAALGFFYWEPAWIPVQSVYDEKGIKKENAAEIEKQNKAYWEEWGSGWAASYATEYDPDDAGLWYGGSSMDNQAVFDFNGYPMPSLQVYNPDYLKYGAVASVVSYDGYTYEPITIEVGNTLDVKNQTVYMNYTDSSKKELEVDWNKEDIEKINQAAESSDGIGTYILHGTLKEDSSYQVECEVSIEPKNLLEDAGFEKEPSAWSVTGEGASVKSGEDKRNGEKCLHFWFGSDFSFKAANTTKVTEPGYYNASIYVQGLSSAGTRDGESLTLSASTGDGTVYTPDSMMLGGWCNWQKIMVNDIYVSADMIKEGNNTIVLALNAVLQAETWGTADDAVLYKNDTKANIADVNIVLDKTSYIYTGSEMKPAVTVKDGDKTLLEGTDYTVVYQNNINVGQASVLVTGAGKYSGSRTLNFEIKAVSKEPEPTPQNPSTPIITPPVTNTDPTPSEEPKDDTQEKPSDNDSNKDDTIKPSDQNPDNTTKPSDNNQENIQPPADQTDQQPSDPSTDNQVKDKGTKITNKKQNVVVKVTSANKNNPEAAYQRPQDKTKEKISIPKSIVKDGVTYKITSIADNAFKGNKKVKSITVPVSVKKIGKNVFYNCKNLKTIVIKSKKLNSKNVHAKAFRGIAKGTVIKVSASKYKAYKKLFKKKGLNAQVKIKKI